MNKQYPVLSVMKHDMEAITTKDIWEKLLLPTSAAGSVELGDCPTPQALSPEQIDLPTFPDSVYQNLPAFLQKVVAKCGSKEEKDMMLMGALATMGSGLPKVYGFYGERRVYPYFFLFITAQASAGKGKLEFCRQLVNPIHEGLREQSILNKEEYKTGMKQYNMLKWNEAVLPKPGRPPELMLFIPANSSASGFFQLLFENDGRGLIFETEGDTLVHAFKSDFSDYSDGLRKGFHHEMISLFRKTNHEHFEIKHPCIAGVFSGTPHQVLSLIPDAEDGLLSRFAFYHMNTRTQWKDPLAMGNNRLEDYFDALGQEFFALYKALDEHPAIEFSFTLEQHDQFNDFFDKLSEKYIALQGTEFLATVRRLGLIAFRMAMILTTLRIMESGNFSQTQQCQDSDFQRVLSMIRVLIRHSSHVFSQLPAINQSANLKNKKEQFLDQLPEKFNHKDFIDVAKSMVIIQRTAERYIAAFCEKGLVRRDLHDSYTNLMLEDANNSD